MSTTLGTRIRQLREQAGLTQLDLAHRLNVSNTTLCQYESGYRIPSDDIKIKIATFFNVSVDYLLGQEERTKAVQDGPPLSAEKRKAIELIYNAPDDELAPLIPFLEKMFPKKSE